MTPHRYCDGIRRRDFFRAGALGAAGLGLADYLRLAAAGEVKPAKATDADALVRGAFLRTLSRPPTAAEAKRGAAHLGQASSRAEGLHDLLWALLNTREYVTNH